MEGKKFYPFGNRLLVRKETQKKEESGRILLEAEAPPYYGMGRVVCGGTLYLNKLVVFPMEKAHRLGCDFQKDLVVLDLEDIHGTIDE